MDSRHHDSTRAPPDHITISRLSIKDSKLLKELAQLQDEIFSCYKPNRLKELEETISCTESSALYLAFSGDSILGFIQIRHFGRRDEWVVKGVGVARYYRRKGIGSALLSEAKRFVNNGLGKRLVSYVNKKNIASLRLHEKMGFCIEELEAPLGSKRIYRLVTAS